MTGAPDGLVYRPDFVDEQEETALLELLERLDYRAVTMRGQTARRTVRHYGYDYDYEHWRLVPADPLPGELGWLRARCAELADRRPDELAQTLVSRYPPGAGIGWHRDAPMFGSRVIGVSLRAACRMRFQRGRGEARQTYALELEPRSAYVLAGAARWSWQHSIPATRALRYSITFRSLRREQPGSPPARPGSSA